KRHGRPPENQVWTPDFWPEHQEKSAVHNDSPPKSRTPVREGGHDERCADMLDFESALPLRLKPER
ncbi:MAG: hypothetical protein AAF441_04820, partial [Pseudomonadota bacterium]